MFCGSCIYFRPLKGEKEFPRLGRCGDEPFNFNVLEDSLKCPHYQKKKN